MTHLLTKYFSSVSVKSQTAGSDHFAGAGKMVGEVEGRRKKELALAKRIEGKGKKK